MIRKSLASVQISKIKIQFRLHQRKAMIRDGIQDQTAIFN